MLLVGVVVAAAAPAAQASSNDVATADRYVAIVSGLFRSLIAAERQEAASMDAFVVTVRDGCPGSVPQALRVGTPIQQRIWTALVGDETSGDLLLAVLHPLAAAYRRAADRIERLHWADAKVARVVRTDARRAAAALTLTPLNLCADVFVAAASHFTRVPPDLTRYATRASRLFKDSDPALGFGVPVRQLAPDISPVERRRLRALRSLEATYGRQLGSVFLPRYAALVTTLRGP